MRDELIRRNVLIVIIALLIFSLASSLIWNHFTRNNMQNELVNISVVVNEQISETTNETELQTVVKNLTKNQQWLTIVVANSHGNILIDSSNDSVGDNYFPNLSSDELNRANEIDVKNKHLYNKDNELFYITKLNDDIIVRTSITIADNNLGILESLFFVFVVAIIVVFLSLIFTRKTTQNIVDAFNSVSSNLKLVNEGKYEEIDTVHRYKEVAEAIKEINVISNNIYTSLKTIKDDSEKLQFLINNMDQGFLVLNNKGNIILINNYAKRIAKVNEDVISLNIHNLNYEKIILEKIDYAIENNENIYFDVKINELGKIFYVTIDAFDNPWNEFSDTKRIYLIKLSDVTKERLEEKNKSEFIANASHELKTPITSISGFSELLLSSSESYSEQDINFLNIIHNESIKMKDTIDQLLLLTNIENRKESFDLNQDVDLELLINEELANLREPIEKMQLNIDLKLDIIHITSNEILIKEIIRNLLGNAVKYNKNKGSITISTYKNNKGTVLSFVDTGIGMEEKMLDKIFERFYRIDESHNSKTSGTGIGLNLVKQICNILNAKINVESKIDSGSSFIIELNN